MAMVYQTTGPLDGSDSGTAISLPIPGRRRTVSGNQAALFQKSFLSTDPRSNAPLYADSRLPTKRRQGSRRSDLFGL
jgi:hypothetical protein